MSAEALGAAPAAAEGQVGELECRDDAAYSGQALAGCCVWLVAVHAVASMSCSRVPAGTLQL
jgi:hypothetical protein